MAAKDLKRSIPSVQLQRRRRNRYLKIRAYEGLHDLNRGFQITLNSLDRLDKLAIFHHETLLAYRNMAEELRAIANAQLLAALRDAESQDALRFQKLRLKWEQRPFPKVPKRILNTQRKQATRK